MSCMFISRDIIPLQSSVLHKKTTRRMDHTLNVIYNCSSTGEFTTEDTNSSTNNTGNDDDNDSDEVFHPTNFQGYESTTTVKTIYSNGDVYINPENVLKDSDGDSTSCNEPDSEHSECTGSSLDLRMKKLKEFQYQNVEVESTTSVLEDSGAFTAADLQTARKRLCLVKAYAQIKEEMEKSTAKNIADHLYQHQDKLLSGSAHETIHTLKTRPETVEKLLKRVLMGPNVAHDVFITILRQDDKCLADLLHSINPTEEDLKEFLALEKQAESTRHRQNKSKPNGKFVKRHRSILKHWLNDKNVVDSINDQFLSRLFFRIDEHTHIADSAIDTRTKLSLLLHTIENCQHQIRNVFYEILKSDTVCMSHVVDRLQNKKATEPRQNEKRKSLSDEPSSSTPAKQRKSRRKNLCPEKEATIVQSLETNKGENVKQKLLEVDLEYEKSEEGSIIIQLIPKSIKALQKLKNSCRTGSIKDFVPDVFKNNISDMEEGEYLLTFTIYLLPTAPYSNDDKKVMFHLEFEESTSIDINESSKLLCQELEITDNFLTILQEKGIVSGDIKREISKLTRRKKIQHVLDEISIHGVKGYNILKDYIETVDKNLHKELITREETRKVNKAMRIGTRVSGRPQSASPENRKELFYTASLLLVVKKTVSDEKKIEKNEVEMTCESILSSKCYFTEGSKNDSDDSDEEFHSLNENWLFNDPLQENRGNTQKPDGKRKLRGLAESQDEKPPRPDSKRVNDTPTEDETTLAEYSRKSRSVSHEDKSMPNDPQSDKKKLSKKSN